MPGIFCNTVGTADMGGIDFGITCFDEFEVKKDGGGGGGEGAGVDGRGGGKLVEEGFAGREVGNQGGNFEVDGIGSIRGAV